MSDESSSSVCYHVNFLFYTSGGRPHTTLTQLWIRLSIQTSSAYIFIQTFFGWWALVADYILLLQFLHYALQCLIFLNIKLSRCFLNSNIGIISFIFYIMKRIWADIMFSLYLNIRISVSNHFFYIYNNLI